MFTYACTCKPYNHMIYDKRTSKIFHMIAVQITFQLICQWCFFNTDTYHIHSHSGSDCPLNTTYIPVYAHAMYIFIILRMWRLRVSQIEEKDSYLTLTHNSSSLTTLTTKYILADPKIREIFSYIISYEEPLSLNSGNILIYRYILLCKKYEKRLNPVQC